MYKIIIILDKKKRISFIYNFKSKKNLLLLILLKFYLNIRRDNIINIKNRPTDEQEDVVIVFLIYI